MRKGLALALGVLTLVMLAGVSFAGAPIFVGVPGVINIGGADTGAPYSGVYPFNRYYSDVFAYDGAVIGKEGFSFQWSFIQSVGATGLDFRINGVGPIASAANAIIPPDPTNNHGAEFFIADVGGGNGSTALADTYGNLVPAGAEGAATIDLYVSDSADVSSKQVLVTVDDGGTDASSIATSPSLLRIDGRYPGQWRTSDDGVNSRFVQLNGLLFESTDNGYMVTGNTGGSINGLGYGAVLSPYPLVPVATGKNYRLRTNVLAAGVDETLPQTVMYLKTIIGEGFDLLDLTDNDPGFGAQAIQEVPNEDWSSALLSPAQDIDNGMSYEVIYAPPQGARLDGVTHNVDNLSVSYRVLFFGDFWHTDIAGFTPDANEGSVIFQNTEIDAIDIPTSGSGVVRGWWTDSADFNPAGLVDQGQTDVAGWKAKAVSFTFGSTNGQDDPTRLTFGDPGTSAVSLNANDFTLFSEVAGNFFVSYLIGDPNLLDGTATDTSAIPSATVAALADSVYYRVTANISASDNDVTSNPNFRIRLGNPYSRYDNSLSIRDGDAASAVVAPTLYEVWMKGLPASAWDMGFVDINNLMTAVEVIDYSDVLGGETYTVNEVLLETFPVGLF